MRPVLVFVALIAMVIGGFIVARKLGFFGPDAVPAAPPAAPEASIDTGSPLPDHSRSGAAEAGAAIILPSFDIVRVTAEGSVVVAGRATPGVRVTVFANGKALTSEIVGPDGSFTVFVETLLDQGPVEFTLSSEMDGGFTVTSEETIIIFVPGPSEGKPLILRTMPGAPSVVLQRPDDGVADQNGEVGPLSLETIDYDNTGGVLFSGRAIAGSTVHIYANQAFVAQGVAGEDGSWTIAATIRPGRYMLQIIQLDQFGQPAFAIEVPFERVSVENVQLEDGKVVVQPGNSLWVIARRAYGEGTQYTIIFAANMDRIRDPDLIFPGQVFVVPENPDSSEGTADEGLAKPLSGEVESLADQEVVETP